MKCAFCGIHVSLLADRPRIVYGGGFNLAPRVIHGDCQDAFFNFTRNL